uniref:Uncharacterized protein n=1 Tax=Leersia perrieri TaxID=77586 RepID=A0A0D9VBW0_9ORYZ
MDQIASRRSSPSYLAFSPELHYLAAGSASKKGAVDELLLFSACEGAVGVDFRCEGEFGLSSPACRISWSFPFGDRSMGLVSAGLEDGSVAVYDPRPHDDWAYGRFDDDVLLLRDGKPPPFFVCNSSSKIDVVRGDVVDGDWEFIEKPKPEEEESTWEIVGSENLIASFSDHTAPVRGLVFSPHMPSVLASGAESGTVRLFDVSHLSGEVVPSLVLWDTRKLANPVLSFCMNSGGVGTMAWSSHNNSILMTSTNSDKLTFWNIDGINKKVQVIQEFDSPGICFDAQWSRAGIAVPR